MVKRWWNSILLSGLILVGCGRGERSPESSVLVYCTPGSKVYAAAVRAHLSRAGAGEVILAPLGARDLVTALSGTRAGDLVVCLGERLPGELAGLGFVRDRFEIGRLTPCLVSTRPIPLERTVEKDMRLGFGKADSPLERSSRAALSPGLADGVEAHIGQRSVRPSELVRLLRLEALDAVFVWDNPALTRGLERTVLPGSCPLVAIQLSCSEKPTALLDAVREIWADTEAAEHLRAIGVKRVPQSGRGVQPE